MSYCRTCPNETVATICGACVQKLRDLSKRASTALPLMGDEIAKTTAKKSKSGGGGGVPDAISFNAYQVREDLIAATKLLQARADTKQTGNPKHLQRDAQQLQEPTMLRWVDDPILYLLEKYESATYQCERIIDNQPETIEYGPCTNCGGIVSAPADRERFRCRTCQEPHTKAGMEQARHERLLESFSGARMDRKTLIEALAQCGLVVAPPTITKWYNNGKLQRDDKKRYLFDDVVHLVELMYLKKTQKTPQETHDSP